MGRDGLPRGLLIMIENFNPLSPHGERLRPSALCPACTLFQSTLPAWGETAMRIAVLQHAIFQSTLPVWGETATHCEPSDHISISIHSPRMGRDVNVFGKVDTIKRFQSTLPVWGETYASLLNSTTSQIPLTPS